MTTEPTFPHTIEAWIELLKSNVPAFNAAHAAWRKENQWGGRLDLQGADLRNANLQSADLAAVDLRGADLRGANLRNAKLGNSYLRDAIFSSEEQVKLARKARGWYIGKNPIIQPLEETQEATPASHVDAGMGIKADGRIFDGSLKINQPGICSRALGIERS